MSEDSIIYDSHIDQIEKQNESLKGQSTKGLTPKNLNKKLLDQEFNQFEFKDLYLSEDASTNMLKVLMNIRRFINKLYYSISGYTYPSHDFSVTKIYPPFKFYYKNLSWRVKYQVYPSECLMISSSKWTYCLFICYFLI